MSAGRRVLLVEDDPELRSAYRLVLGGRGLSVETAATAEEAVASLRERAADVVVADLGLPDLSGPGLLRELRDAAPDALLLVLTGEASEGARHASEAAGADAFLVKPVSGAELADRLTDDGG